VTYYWVELWRPESRLGIFRSAPGSIARELVHSSGLAEPGDALHFYRRKCTGLLVTIATDERDAHHCALSFRRASLGIGGLPCERQVGPGRCSPSGLELLRKAGTGTARAGWRPHFMFQDSPTCLSFDPVRPPKPCSDWVLMKLIPDEAHVGKIPCRCIPLNERGETVDFLLPDGNARGIGSGGREIAESNHRSLGKGKCTSPVSRGET
jgi:hypothetical protein